MNDTASTVNASPDERATRMPPTTGSDEPQSDRPHELIERIGLWQLRERKELRAPWPRMPARRRRYRLRRSPTRTTSSQKRRASSQREHGKRPDGDSTKTVGADQHAAVGLSGSPTTPPMSRNAMVGTVIPIPTIAREAGEFHSA